MNSYEFLRVFQGGGSVQVRRVPWGSQAFLLGRFVAVVEGRKFVKIIVNLIFFRNSEESLVILVSYWFPRVPGVPAPGARWCPPPGSLLGRFVAIIGRKLEKIIVI